MAGVVIISLFAVTVVLAAKRDKTNIFPIVDTYGMVGQKTIRTGTFTNQPVAVTYKVHVGEYNYGVPVLATATFVYKNKVKHTVWGYKARNSPTFAKRFKRKKYTVKSHASWDYERGTTFNDPTVYLDRTIVKKIKLRPYRARTVRYWVNLDRCFVWPELITQEQKDYFKDITGFTTPPLDYPCVMANVHVKWEGLISGRWKGHRYHASTFGRLSLTNVKIINPQEVLPNPQRP